MESSGRLLSLACAGVVGLAVGAPPARGGYIMSVSAAGGADSLAVIAGQSFQLEVVLGGEAGTQHNASLFDLVFTQPGLIYEGYAWAPPYENETNFDFSAPLWSSLPAVIDSDLAPGAVSNVTLSNVVPAGSFGLGTMLTLTLRVPEQWEGAKALSVVAVPDTLSDGFEVVPTMIGGSVSIVIVPGPGGFGLMLGALVLCSRRRWGC